MKTIGAYEAKTHLSKILKQVSHGKGFIITKNGLPLAQLIPFDTTDKQSPQETIQALKSFRKEKKLDGLSISECINEGRRS